VPALSVDTQRDYLSGLLRIARPGGSPELHSARAKARVEFGQAADETEVNAKLADAAHLPAVERQAAVEAAVLRLAQPEVEQRTQHTLQAFTPLLERNPRSMKRLVNAYGMARATEILRGVPAQEGNGKALERVALWTILSLRWPLLADYLAENETDVERMRDRSTQAPDEPKWLQKLWHDNNVLAVLEGDAPTLNATLDAEAIRVSVGRVA
jgi:hypothetical protein